jgi:hypothetical protein
MSCLASRSPSPTYYASSTLRLLILAVKFLRYDTLRAVATHGHSASNYRFNITDTELVSHIFYISLQSNRGTFAYTRIAIVHMEKSNGLLVNRFSIPL